MFLKYLHLSLSSIASGCVNGSTERCYSLGVLNWADISVAGNYLLPLFIRKLLAGIVSIDVPGSVYSNTHLPVIRNSKMFIILY